MLPSFRSPYTDGAQEAFALPRNPLCFPLASYSGTWLPWYYGFCCDPLNTSTAADKDAMQPLEPAFENLLCTANLHEDLISALRKEEILDREMFVALDSTEEGLAASAKDASKLQLHTQERSGKAEATLQTRRSRRRCACTRRAYHYAVTQSSYLLKKTSKRLLKLEVRRQTGLHLDNTLTKKTKRPFSSSMPATIEELRETADKTS